jgi:erythromycin esterase-like protein
MAHAHPDRSWIEEVKRRALPLGEGEGFDTLVEELSRSRLVFLGESTHGTEEFYEWRRRISSRLVSEHGFRFIAVEGDWPSCWKVNEWVTGRAKGGPRQAFSAFHRWPTWMWANASVLKLAEWLHARNARVPSMELRAGFYGLDVYSVFESIDSVLRTLQKIDPALAARARELYGCMKAFKRNEKAFAQSLLELPEGCEKEVTDALRELLELRITLRERNREFGDAGGREGELLHALFNVEQNARVVKDAEQYYRTMIRGDGDSWNVRDRHMMETLERLLGHHGPSAKAIVWAHNQHVGDHRGSSLEEGGQVTLGGLARERWGEDAVSLVGFGTHRGEVVAAQAWGGAAETLELPPARPGSYESIFHQACVELGRDSLYLPLRDARGGLLGRERKASRSVGVVFYPRHEHFGNYLECSIARRFDAFIHVDRSRAVPLLAQEVERKDLPEAWPTGR